MLGLVEREAEKSTLWSQPESGEASLRHVSLPRGPRDRLAHALPGLAPAAWHGERGYWEKR